MKEQLLNAKIKTKKVISLNFYNKQMFGKGSYSSADL